MKKIFLSGPHGSNDELFTLTEALEAEGMQVWRRDSAPLGTGSDWTEEILSAIKRCDVFVAVLHKANLNVLFELGYALGSRKSVLLIRKAGGEIPFDVATFPVMLVDTFDARSVSETVEWIKRATIRSQSVSHDFQTGHDMLHRLCEDESYLDEIEPRVFEECIAKVFEEKGFQVELMAMRNELGFDIAILDLHPHSIAIVEVKKQNRNSRISVTEIQRVLGAAVGAHANSVVVVTAGGFTSSARFFAEGAPIRVELLTIDDLLNITRGELTSRCK